MVKRRKIIVSNSTPLINFATIDRTDILNALYKELYVPEAVWRETVANATKYVSARRIQKIDWIKRKTIINTELLKLLKGRLDDGEAESIVLAVELSGNLILLDV